MSAQKLTSGERAYLRSLANRLDAIFQIGKGGINHNFINQINEALEARELIKIGILENSEETPKEAAAHICEETGAQSVQIIGRKIVLYRQASKEENRKLELKSK